MCGILGTIGELKKESFEKALAAIVHRGPDDQGHHSFENVRLGHRRLSIQDTSQSGHQPMTTPDGRFTIVFNGEIYNHWELRKELENDYDFRSRSDTETLLYGFAKHGTEVLNRLNGIFAFGILDRFKREVFLVRDHFGVKPLYIYQDPRKVLFSSEIKALKHFSIDRSINTRSIAHYLHFLYSPLEDTPFQCVKKLQPGHFARVSIDNFHDIEFHQYYDIPFNGQFEPLPEEEIVEELDSTLNRAVVSQLLSDVPVGFFLSGGLDSSLLAAMAVKHLEPGKTPCFTVNTADYASYDGFASDLPYAKQVAEQLNVDLHVVRSNPDVASSFDRFIYELDEPQADPAPFHVRNIAEMAADQGVKVLIGGAAGDDVFSGYRRHIALNYNGLLNLIPKPLNTVVSWLPASNPLVRRMQKLTTSAGMSKAERMFSYFAWMKWSDVTKLFCADIQAELLEQNPCEKFVDLWKNIPGETSDLNKMLYWEMKGFLPDHNLNYTDKMGMSQGVEVRVPYLDKELVEFACRIPPEMKLKKNTTKYILRKVAERYLPKEVIYRPKTGFGAPVRQWITGELSTMVDERLSPQQLEHTGLFDPVKVRSLIIANKKGHLDASYSIWALMGVTSWLNQFKSTT